MAQFVMPALGADMEAGTLLAWRIHPGEIVKRGDIVVEVHTDKADIEVEVFTSGVVERLLVEPGTLVPTGTPLALILEEGEEAAAAPAPAPEQAPAPAPAEAAPAPEAAAAPPGPPAVSPERILVSPSARQLAAELGVELAGLKGTGPNGRILRRDVQRAAEAGAAAPPAPPPAEAPPAAPPAVPPPAAAPALAAEDAQAAMRRAIAAAMSRSKREIPHVYLSTTIDMTRATAWLATENLRRSVPDRLLHGVLLVKAVALALRDFPELNARWQGDQVVRSERIHVGIAIFLRGGGLVAPAIHDTDTLGLDELMRSFRDLTSRARAFSLRSGEMSDPTVTVTSIGERGVEAIYPIIVPPQVAIAGFGKIVERPWIHDGQLLPCPVVTTTLSVDHRVSDGHRAGAFLTAVDERLQEPEEL
jgi:pyruvate dehydrogenase E2 component (dihydrolipoamide acetyltransferase)